MLQHSIPYANGSAARAAWPPRIRGLVVAVALAYGLVAAASAREYHVTPHGDDSHPGTIERPFRTIAAAARAARPGDVITVHEGIYRERIAPPRGGESNEKRIVYRAAPSEHVVIKGSEPIHGWQKVGNDTWKVVVSNDLFGSFNPYNDLIHGDWFASKGREHHSGAVYLNGHWLTEAAALEDVLQPVGAAPPAASGPYLLNVAWFRHGETSDVDARTPAAGFAAQHGIQAAACSEGGECIGWIEHGDWVRYDGFEFGTETTSLEFRAASETLGGLIEVRLDAPDGELLGSCAVPNTGGWQSWDSFTAKIKPTSGVRSLFLSFKDARRPAEPDALWFARVGDTETTIWAQFPGVNPNEAEVEINVRQAVFYPEKPGVNYLTVRGFTMMHAATPWAPPTAEQIGLIGTHWSRGWIIEDCDISYSTCCGVTLGKYGDRWDNTSQNSAEGYVKTIDRALAEGWSREKIGHHIVQNNRISHCEQAGIVGSLGAAFCTVTGNEIHDIHVRQLFSGAEMAGIKLHAAIDTEISRNHIYRTNRGIWLDWMAQGTRVTRNLLHDNGPSEDLFVEVNHGPFMVDHNLLLSPIALFDMSEGGAYAHNLFAGRIGRHPELGRETPFHPAHTTEVAGLERVEGGDDRFFNNIFVAPGGLSAYNDAAQPVQMAGNVFLRGAAPGTLEASPLVQSEFNPELRLTASDSGVRLQLRLDCPTIRDHQRPLVTTDLLGRTHVSNLRYEMPDGSPYRLDTDWFDRKRDAGRPFPGPFELGSDGRYELILIRK